MTTSNISNEQLITAYNDIKTFPTTADLEEFLGISAKTIRNRIGMLRKTRDDIISRATQSPNKDWKAQVDSFEVKEIKKEQRLVDIIPDNHFLSGVTTLIDEDGNIRMQYIKTASDPKKKINIAKEVMAAVNNFVPPAKPIPNTKLVNSELMSVYPVGDSHAGLYSYIEETGVSFDLNEFKRVQRQAIDDLVASVPNSEIALFIGLGDETHADNSKNRTPRSGHELDVHGRHTEVIRVLIDTRLYQIQRLLEKHHKVIVRINSGNHDIETSLMIALILEAYYRNEPRVEVITSPNPYYFYQFGKNMIATAHGDGAKDTQMNMVMAVDQPQMWADTKYRVCFLGHYHHKSIKEYMGVDVEITPTIAAPDYYSHHKGYRSKRRIQAITYHKENGEYTRATVNIT